MTIDSSALIFHDSGEERVSKSALKEIVPRAIDEEVRGMLHEGRNITVGSTPEVAYKRPDKVIEVFKDLDTTGANFASEMGRFDLGQKALLSAVRFGSPIDITRRWAKGKLEKREQRAEQLRKRLLYDRVDVQGMPWHEQNGKALALGTIVDAEYLSVHDEFDGLYATMSGRLDMDSGSFHFGGESGWLSGLSLHEALVATGQKYRRASVEKATEQATDEIAKLDSFLQAPVQPGFKDIVLYCTDSLGIRSRKEEVRGEIARYVDEHNSDDEVLMMSVGCGTALPMLEVMKDITDKGKASRLILIDQDPIALAAAISYAEQMGLEEQIEVHCEQLFVGKGRKTKVFDLQQVVQGRQLDICEDSGLREYFPNFLYKDLTSQAWATLKKGGIMTTGNMNVNRPQPEFLHGLMGWPIPVTMRSMSQIADLHTAAGVPRDATRFRVTQDGVYTLAFSTKA